MPGFGEFLFGVAARRPLAYRRLLQLRAGIYTTIADLHAEILRSDEPIPFARIDRAAFSPLRNGTAWGSAFDCAWLRITGEVPSGASDARVQLGIRGEGLVHSAAGDVLDSVSTVWAQADLPHSAGHYRDVRGVDLSAGGVEFYADIAYNGLLLYDVGRGVYHGARLVRRDDEAHGLYYDYLTLFVLADATDDDALEKDLLAALDEAHRRWRDGDTSGARGALAAHLTARSTSAFVYSAVGHGHLDMAWLWPLRETRRKAARTYVKALNNIDERDGYVFGTSQPQQMQWMKQEQPALFARMQDAVADGRLELQGAFWVEPDTNLPSGESLVRQALVGRRFLAEEFGLAPEDMRVCWLPDTFGYSGNLPQILKKSGMDFFQTIKLAWNKVNTFPHRTFHWSGIDGSTVLVHMPPEGDYNSRAAADGLLRGIRQYPERDLDSALLVYGSGDGGGGPGEVHLELLERERNLRGLPRVEPSSSDAFFRALEKREISHTHVGELYLETHQGTYTTQAESKRLNRVVERKLHNAEALAVIIGDSVAGALEQHWRDVLLNQFHDIIPGSSITRVNREAVQAYRAIEASLDDTIARQLAELPRADGPAAINLTGLPRREHVRVNDTWYRAEAEPYASAQLEPVGDVGGLLATSDTLSNGVLTLRFDEGGQIVSCVDEDGHEHAGGGLNRLVLHEDPFQFPFDAWDIDQRYFEKKPAPLRASSIEMTLDGPMALRRHVYVAPKCRIVQTVILEIGSPVVRFDTTVEWHQTHRMLRAEFRPTHFGPTVDCEIQFGHISRVTTQNDAVETAQFEVCAHKWVATQDDAAGFALLNDGKYGHRAKDGLLSLNLLRSPTFPDKTVDRGTHHFTYAFRPFARGDLHGVIRDGYRLNNPLLLTENVELPSAVSTDAASGVVVETIKPAESGAGIVLRLYESLGAATTTALRTGLPHRNAVETDLLEREVGPADLGRLEFGPFEIKTILLER